MSWTIREPETVPWNFAQQDFGSERRDESAEGMMNDTQGDVGYMEEWPLDMKADSE